MWLKVKKSLENSFLQNMTSRQHVFILILLSTLAYCRTVGVPFYLDDLAYVVNNPLLRDVGNFFSVIPIPENVLEDTYNNFKLRPLSYLSFSLNYFVNGPSPAGYHIVNIAIHTINSILVYVFVISIFGLSITKHGIPGRLIDATKIKYVAFFSAALFVVHPVMTNAVTYITQRMASLATLFYLATVVMYVRCLITADSGSYRSRWYGLALTSCCAAMLTKEIALTLPMMVLVLDVVFCRASIKQRLLRLAPFMATLGIIPYIAIGLKHGETVQTGSKLLSAINLINFTGISTAEYFMTQMKVLVFYLRLMVIPNRLSLEHDFPLSTTFADPDIHGSILVHLLLLGYAVFLLYRYRNSSSFHDCMKQVAGFGIVWFYLTLSVESSIIPITETAMEYRLYLPAAGLLLFVVSTVQVSFDRYWPRIASPLSMLIMTSAVVIFTGLTVARNEVWRAPEIFWRQTISQYPHLGRPYANLADYYLDRKRPEEAIKVYREAIDHLPNLAVLHYELGLVYIQAEKYKDAVKELKVAILMEPDKREAYDGLVRAKCCLGQFDKAVQIMSEAGTATGRYYE